MHRRSVVVLRLFMLIVLLTGMIGQPQSTWAATVNPITRGNSGTLKNMAPDTLDRSPVSNAPDLAPVADSSVSLIAGPVTVPPTDSSTASVDIILPDKRNESEPAASLTGVDPYLTRAGYAYANNGNLSIEPITAYNLIVDSNVLSPSSYGPSAATLGAKFCNTSTGSSPANDLTNVWTYVGNYDQNMDGIVGDGDPGVYPVHNDTTHALFESGAGKTFDDRFPDLATLPSEVDHGDPARFYALEQEAGSLTDATDASRYIGTLKPGECKTEYWLVSYPRKAKIGGSWVDVTGGVKPEDDLWLWYFFWATSGATSNNSSYLWRPVTMRNEISAMANKIWPNGDNKVPQQYLAAIQDVLGWDTITPSGTSNAFPGDTVTSQGIWYDFGNVGAGFDNNGDLVPDRNAWVQPIGDPNGYDPGCFRLVQTYGLVIVKLNDGTEKLIPFVDQMYFENIPDNNNGVVGLVYYRYIALNGACTAGLTPYQEVASGYDNEKFNGDFGAGIPPLQSQETNMTLDKTGQANTGKGSNINYTMTFTLPQDGDPGMSFTVGNVAMNMPLVFQETIPAGTTYVAGSAQFAAIPPAVVPAFTGIIFYSHDGGVTWSTTEAPASTVTHIQWWLDSEIVSQDSSEVKGRVAFSVAVPLAYTHPIVSDTGCLKLGNGNCFTEDTHTTLVDGTSDISGYVFCDDGPQSTGVGQPCVNPANSGILANGTMDVGGGEPGMPNVSVYLYYDSNGNGSLDAADRLLRTNGLTNGSGYYEFLDLPNGTYFTKVIKSDPEIQQTYGPTTPEARTAVVNDANVTGLDFGFAPPLSIQKSVEKTTGIGGSTFNYTITLNNNLPGSGGPGNSCSYKVWSTLNTTSAEIPKSETGTKAWQNQAGLLNFPDGDFGYTVLSDSDDIVGVSGLNTADRGNETITRIQLVLYAKELVDLKGTDELNVYVYNTDAAFDNPANGSKSWTYQFLGSEFTGGTGSTYTLTKTLYDSVTPPSPQFVPTGGWGWDDFAANKTELQFEGNKGAGGGSSGDFGVDAVGFIITTNGTCSGADSMLDPVPLTDLFRNDHFAFVSSNPPVNSQTPSGNQTTLAWNNVGPIYPGGSKQVTVTMRALDPGPAGASSPNTAESLGSKFSNGINANSPVSDTVTVSITDATATSQISGRVFDDNDGDGWAFATACIPGTTNPDCSVEAVDTALQSIKVNLLACQDRDGALITSAGSNRTCADQGGEWKVYASRYTDPAGYYQFTLLPQGFYRVQVDTATLPTGAANSADPNITAINGTPYSCASCDNQTYGDLRLDAITFGAITGANNFYSLNFGYNIPNGPFTLGDTIYYDWNGDGTQDATAAEGFDTGINGVTVELLRPDGSVVASYLTAHATGDGFYQFTGLPAGVYTVRVVDSGLPAYVSQTGDPDESGTCSTCDNRSTISLTASNDTRDFGYKPAGTAVIGDTVFKDVNGDRVQSGVQETGIPNITVNLLADFNGAGYVIIKSASTDSSGKYQFTGLPDGTYRVQVETTDTDLPKDGKASSYVPTTGSLYSDIIVSGGVVTSMTNTTLGGTSTTANGFGDAVENDPLYLDADFGFAPLASIGDTVYFDVNSNGTQDINEPGINGVTVTLHRFTDTNGDRRYDPADTLLGAVGVPIMTNTVNGVDGYYQFSGLLPDYYVVVVTPGSLTLTGDPNTDGFSCAVGILHDPADPGEPSSVVCDNRDGMYLHYGTNYSGADFGYQQPGFVGDTVWIDTNADGIRNFTDVNSNGVQDPGEGFTEAGIPNITVTLRDCNGACGDGDDTTTSMLTDADGFYFFTGLTSDNYQIQVNPANLPVGLTPTFEQNDVTPDNLTDFTVNGSNVVSAINGQACTGCDLHIDYGYRFIGNTTITGTVCLEVNSSDGQCDNINTNDAAYQGVTLYLYILNDSNTNGVRDPGETVTLVQSIQTNGSGDFSFVNVPNGEIYYIVALAAPQDALNLTTVKTQDTPPETTDLVNNTDASGDTISASQVIRVVAGDTSVTEVDFAFESNEDYDFGDLPESYGTTLEGVPDGPRHIVPTVTTLYLGTVAPDAEPNGVASANASSDDDTGDDEDGITITIDPAGTDTDWTNGVAYRIQAVVAAPTIAGSNNDAYLVGWIDFNQDGNFADADEMVINQGVDAGTLTINDTVASGVFNAASIPGGGTTLNSRFRLYSYADRPLIPSLAYAGIASSGEVEDYVQEWELTIDKDTSTPSVSVNGTVIYSIALSNSGNQPLTNIQVVDTLPDFNGGTAGTGYTVNNVTATGGLTVNYPGFDGSTITKTNLLSGTDTLAAGASAIITITLTLSNATVGTYENTVYADSVQTGRIDDDGTTAQDADTPAGADPATDEDVTVALGGAITIEKQTLPDGNAEIFTFTPSYNGGTTFTLRDGNTNTSGSLAVGSYTVEEATLAGWNLTSLVCADPDSGSSVNLGTRTATIDVDAGENITCTYTNTKLATISGSVLADTDNDNDGDAGIGSVTLTLYIDVDGNGSINGTDAPFDTDPSTPGIQSTVVSAADGSYSFSNLPAGSYIVVETQPAGYLDVIQSDTIVDDAGSPADAAITLNHIPVNLAAGETDSGNTFVEEQPGTIQGQVRDDTDHDGNPADADSGISGLTITLRSPGTDATFGTADDITSTTTTNGTGNYTFNNVAPGSYRIEETNPTGYVSTYDTEGANNDQIDVTVAAGTSSTGNDFLDTNRANVSGQVRNDTDNDGNPADADSGISGVTITLRNPGPDTTFGTADDVTATTTTNASGNYTFSNVAAGSYRIEEANPGGYTSTYDTQGANDDQINIMLVANTNSTGNDFLDWQPGTIRIVEDSLPNNAQDFAYTVTGAGLVNFDLDDDTDGTLSNTRIFSNLTPGSYSVTEIVAAGWNLTGLACVDPDSGSLINLAAGTATIDLDAGETIICTFTNTLITYSISGSVFNDSTGTVNDNFDAGDNPINGVTVQLFAADAGGNPTGPALASMATVGGNYSFPNVPPGNYVVVETDLAGYDSVRDIQGDTTNPDYNRIRVTISTANVIGRDFLDEVVDPSALSKSVIAHNEGSTVPPNVAIGEIVTYEVSITIPAGASYTNARLVDTMERGLSFMGCSAGGITVSDPGLTTNVAGGFAAVCASPTVDDAGGGTGVDVNRRVTFDFGTLENITGADQTLIVTYRAVVLDTAPNVSGINLRNSAQLLWGAASSLAPDTETLTIAEPDLSISKTANATVVSIGDEVTITLTIQHTAQSETNAYDAVVTDVLPAELSYVPGSLECISGAQDADVTCTEAGGTIRAEWSNFLLSGAGSGPGRLTFRVTVNALPPGGVNNIANVAWTSMPAVPANCVGCPLGQQNINIYSTERDYDPASPIDIYGTSDALMLTAAPGETGSGGGKRLPATGFAPNRVTDLSGFPKEFYTSTGDVMVDIPTLGIKLPIVGVPLKNGAWNVTWLGKQAGWLEGTAFPSWNGNSVLTSHVYMADGLPGPFVNLRKLKYGDKIIVHAYGQKYTFEVRENTVVQPNDRSALKHEEMPWLTLVTCKEYDEETDTYRKRVVVRAVLISADSE